MKRRLLFIFCSWIWILTLVLVVEGVRSWWCWDAVQWGPFSAACKDGIVQFSDNKWRPVAEIRSGVASNYWIPRVRFWDCRKFDERYDGIGWHAMPGTFQTTIRGSVLWLRYYNARWERDIIEFGVAWPVMLLGFFDFLAARGLYVGMAGRRIRGAFPVEQKSSA